MNNRGQIVSLAFGSAVALASLALIVGTLSGTNPLKVIATACGFFVMAASGVYVYFALGLVRADTRAEIARLNKMERDFQAPSLPPSQPPAPAPARTYTREIPLQVGENFSTIKIQTAADKYDSLWREMCIRLCVWAEMKGGIKVEQMVGVGEAFPLASNRDWMALTNVLRDSGYIVKDGASALTSRYSSFSQVALVISRGSNLPHPEAYPPSAREIPEKIMEMPEWETAGNA